MKQMTIQVEGLEDVRRRLGRLAPEARKVIRMAVNDTAVEARKQINDRVRERYIVKKTKFNKGLTLTRATNKTLTARLTAKGSTLPLVYFDTRKNGKRKAAQGHQLHSTSLKPIIKNGNKSFVTKVKAVSKNGEIKEHKGLFYRVSKHRYPIEQVYGSSVPVMIGSKKVYGTLEPVIQSDLQKNLQRHIDLVLRRI